MNGVLTRGLVVAAALFGGSTAWAATNLISNGDFSTPNQNGGWTIYSPGVGNWVSTADYGNAVDGVEIGTSTIYGLPCANNGCQNLEINANNFDTIEQTVTGLTPGAWYSLDYLYGGRTSGGPDSMDVYFDGTLLTTNSGSVGVWTPNAFMVQASGTSAILAFAAVPSAGLPSYGNEVTNVVLAAVPETSTWVMMGAGFAALGFAAFRRGRKSAISALA